MQRKTRKANKSTHKHTERTKRVQSSFRGLRGEHDNTRGILNFSAERIKSFGA